MLSVSDKAHRPRVTFSPHGYKRARKAFQNGDPKELIAMMQEASIDSHVAGCLMGRRAGFKKSYTLTAYDDDELSQERRDWFKGLLQRIHLRDFLEAVHDARLYIYNVVDFDWEVIDNHQVPVSFQSFEQHHFKRTDSGELAIDTGKGTRPIPDTALVIENRKTPIMLPVLRDWILKEFGLESWAAFLETFGEDFIIGKYPAGSSDDFKDEVEKAVTAIASSSRGVAPEGTDFEIHGSQRSTGDHQDFTERADKGVSITLLGHANAVEESRGMQVGRNEASYNVKHSLAVDDMHFIEPFVNDFIQLVGDRNFADGRYPRFELKKSKPVDAKKHSEILDTAFRHGAKIHVSEYEKLGIRVDTSEQEWIQKPQTPINQLLD